MLLKGNGNVLERILSPFQLLDSAAASELQSLARGGVSRKLFHHYGGFFRRTREAWLAARPRTVKGLLYVYRSALTGIHLLRTGECVGDVTRLAPTYGFERVRDLVARKAAGREHGALAEASALDDDLERLDSLLRRAHEDSPLPDQASNAQAMNAFLVRMRGVADSNSVRNG
jgi:predicted nucleotidyltransferase